MYKAYKFRLYPNDKQKEIIHKTFGCVRFVYNYFLDECKEKGYQKAYDMCKKLKELDEIREKIRKNSSDISEYMSDDAYGDTWHDNFAYEQAIKKESSLLHELKAKKMGLARIEIIEKNNNSDKVEIGSVVTVKIDDEVKIYKLSGNTVSNLNSDIPEITVNSMLGKSIYHKRVGDSFSYKVNDNSFEGVIIDIK